MINFGKAITKVTSALNKSKIFTPKQIAKNGCIAALGTYALMTVTDKKKLSGWEESDFDNSIKKLSTENELKMYDTLLSNTSLDDGVLLDKLLKSGKLMNRESDNESSVLENLYKIATKQRADGLDNKIVLSNTIQLLANPYTVNQKLGNIPDNYKEEFLQHIMQNKNCTKEEAINYLTNVSNTCAAASIEFNLVDKYPAEFVRMVNDLTSTNKSTEKIVDIKSFGDNAEMVKKQLKNFNIKYKEIGNNQVKIEIKADKNAYLRAKIQNTDQDLYEANGVDLILQSALINLGSKNSYNSLDSTRVGFNGNEYSETIGLLTYEKNFVETIIRNKKTVSKYYQKVDENNVIKDYKQDFEKTKKQLLKVLEKNHNIIVGITYLEKDRYKPNPNIPENMIVGGHEITIIGSKTVNNQTTFICQDSDDDTNTPVEYPEEWLLPRLHHASLPENIACSK